MQDDDRLETLKSDDSDDKDSQEGNNVEEPHFDSMAGSSERAGEERKDER